MLEIWRYLLLVAVHGWLRISRSVTETWKLFGARLNTHVYDFRLGCMVISSRTNTLGEQAHKRRTSRNDSHSATWNISLQWRHNGPDGVSNHQPYHCLLNRLFKRRSKKTSNLLVTGLLRGIHRWPGNSPHKGPATRKIFPFDDVIMLTKSMATYKHWRHDLRPPIPITLISQQIRD